MKNIVLLALFTVFAINLNAQTVHMKEPTVTTFLGIPVDGSKQAMISSLKAKGFTWNSTLECLEGEFNGENCYLYVVTNNNKVYRVVVHYKRTMNESQTIITYNKLCQQFLNNGKYMPTSDDDSDYVLNKNEDISYNLTVKNKQYEASFYQLSKKMDTTGMAKYVREKIKSDKNWENHSRSYKTTYIEMYEDQFMDNQTEAVIDKDTFDRLVWFTIEKQIYSYSSGYTILIYYDNIKNQANGDDL